MRRVCLLGGLLDRELFLFVDIVVDEGSLQMIPSTEDTHVHYVPERKKERLRYPRILILRNTAIIILVYRKRKTVAARIPHFRFPDISGTGNDHY